MAYKIIWSPEALKTFNDIVEYLDKSFTQKEVSKFVGVVNRRLFVTSTTAPVVQDNR